MVSMGYFLYDAIFYSTRNLSFFEFEKRENKKEGKGWKNGEPDSEHIELMTKKFLKD